MLRMEFKTFVNAFVRIPCQIVRTAAAAGVPSAGLESLAGRLLPPARSTGAAAAALSAPAVKPESGRSGPRRTPSPRNASHAHRQPDDSPVEAALRPPLHTLAPTREQRQTGGRRSLT